MKRKFKIDGSDKGELVEETSATKITKTSKKNIPNVKKPVSSSLKNKKVVPKDKKTEKGDKSDKKNLEIAFPEDGTKPVWSDVKKQSKNLTKIRKLKKNSSISDVVADVKKKYEILRSHKCPQDKRNRLVDEVTDLLKGNLDKIIRSHDTARIVQWLLKLGTPEVKKQIVNEIMKDVVNLAQCKYSNRVVQSIMRSCDARIRREMINKCYGHVPKLMSNKLSASILENIYEKFSSGNERTLLRRELFGELAKTMTSSEELNLERFFQENPGFKAPLMSSAKNLLSKLIRKSWSFALGLTMGALYDYLVNCDENDREEFFEAAKSHVPLLIRTKEGANVAMLVVRNSTAKEKKEIVKAVKGEIVNTAMTEPGCTFLLTLIDCVDDTVLMKKMILSTLIDSAEELIKNIHGRKVLLYIVSHRDTHFFHPSLVEELKKSDESTFVKKSKEQRMKELREHCIPVLLGKIKSDPQLWMSEGSIGLVTGLILHNGDGEALTNAFNAIVEYIKSSNEEGCVIENNVVHVLLKKIIKNDSELHQNGKTTFTECVAHGLDKGTIKKWCQTNRGCFTLVFMLETKLAGIENALKEKLFSCKIKEWLESHKSKGGEILLKLLNDEVK